MIFFRVTVLNYSTGLLLLRCTPWERLGCRGSESRELLDCRLGFPSLNWSISLSLPALLVPSSALQNEADPPGTESPPADLDFPNSLADASATDFPGIAAVSDCFCRKSFRVLPSKEGRRNEPKPEESSSELSGTCTSLSGRDDFVKEGIGGNALSPEINSGLIRFWCESKLSIRNWSGDMIFCFFTLNLI
jgi:hypothetical protein